MRTLTCKHKSGGKLAIFEALFKSLPCFQCSWNLQRILYCWWLISGLSSLYKKNLSSSFFNNVKFVGMDQITLKNCNKSSWMQVNQICLTRDRPEQFPSFFVRSFQRNQTNRRWSQVSKAYHFLKISTNCADSMLFHCFYDSWNFVSKYFQDALICSNFAIIEAIMAGTYSLERFLTKTPSTEKQKDK